MIPERRRGPLPAGHRWLIFEERGRLIVVLSEALPRSLEHETTKMALRAWRRHHRPGLVAIPVGIAAGLGWLVQQTRQARQTVAGATAAVTVAAVAGYALTGWTHDPHTRPPVAVAPTPSPSWPQPQPGRPGRPSHAVPRAPVSAPVVAPVALTVPAPPTAVPRVAPVVVPTPGGVQRPVPPVRIVRPPVVVPPLPPKPVPVPPAPPIVAPAQCHLQLQLGKLVRVCI
jgi:hypothetical protein